MFLLSKCIKSLIKEEGKNKKYGALLMDFVLMVVVNEGLGISLMLSNEAKVAMV